MAGVVVIGAGVIGLSVALAAQARGLAVTVVDRIGPAAGASAGNAGAFAFTDILPLASPGILKKAPKWLLDPLGPLTVPPGYALQIAPWMYRFWRACAPSRVEASTTAQTALMDLSKAELEPFLTATGTLSMLEKRGNLQVYEGEGELRASLPGWQARARHGIEFHHMTAAEMAGLQPGLAPRFTHGTFTPGWYSIADPELYTLALAQDLRAKGGQILQAEVTALTPSDTGVTLTLAGAAPLTADQVVLAAGAFSHRLARTLGEKIPLETERGYNTTLPAQAFQLQRQLYFNDHAFVVTPLAEGIRVGGAVELGGLELAPNFRRSKALLAKAARFLPELKTEGGREWMGFRPSMPDCLPIIGRSSASPSILYAFGHGHLGLTQSAATGKLISDLAAGRATSLSTTPFSAARFR